MQFGLRLQNNFGHGLHYEIRPLATKCNSALGCKVIPALGYNYKFGLQNAIRPWAAKLFRPWATVRNSALGYKVISKFGLVPSFRQNANTLCHRIVTLTTTALVNVAFGFVFKCLPFPLNERDFPMGTNKWNHQNLRKLFRSLLHSNFMSPFRNHVTLEIKNPAAVLGFVMTIEWD
jgi:hypothetical protein